MRRAYTALLPALVRRRVAAPRAIDVDVVAFSCERDLPEQVASMRSFLRWAGRPREYLVVSDGTHTDASRALLARVDPCVRVADWTEVARRDLPARVADYAARSPMGKKLALELSLPRSGPTLYADADVLFFAGARELAGLDAGARYLRDCATGLEYMDPRLVADGEGRDPVNGGFFALAERPDWSEALARLARLRGAPAFHTEQTLLHLTLSAAGARPLDAGRYVLSVDDLSAYRDLHAGPAIALRHYTTPVRHKFWCAVGRTPR